MFQKSSNMMWGIAMSLFYLGWLKFLIVGDAVYVADLAIRTIMIALIWQDRHAFLSKPNFPKIKLWFLFFVFLFFYMIFHRILFNFDIAYEINEILFDPKSYSPIKNKYLLIFDMCIGLWLVAITEEYIFRYKLNHFLKEKKIGLLGRYLITSTMFALIHFPQGLISLGETFVWGLFLFFLFHRSQSLHFVIVLHFITNFVAFGIAALGS